MNLPNDLLFEDDVATVVIPQEPQVLSATKGPWKILIVDDEKDVHEVTRIALRRLTFENRPVEFISAFSAAEARKAIHAHADVAIILLDIVMEEENAGLDFIHHIRRELANSMTRIILRTGHPGQAPEEKVIFDYDINDYREKSELTTQRLLTAVVTALRSYRELVTSNDNRRMLKQVIHSSSRIFRLQSIRNYASGILGQLGDLSCLRPLAEDPGLSGFIAGKRKSGKYILHAAIGQYQLLATTSYSEMVLPDPRHGLLATSNPAMSFCQNNRLILRCQSNFGPENIICLEGFEQLSDWDQDLLEMFRLNVLIAFDNIYLNKEVEDTQKELLFTLGEIAESRSPETGHHVKRVGEISRILALKMGLTDDKASLLRLAASMHDLGKLAIHQSILNKPGPLTPEEFAVMKTHSQLGYEMLKSSRRVLLQTAALIAREHHENFNGSGYPQGLKGQDIHIYSRIVALADVYDALGNKRVYKEPWPTTKILDYIWNERGGKFDPLLVDLLFDHLNEIAQVREHYPDGQH